MFIDCPYCGFLVALDERGERPPRCPNCAQRLREDAASVVSNADADDAASGSAAVRDADAVSTATETGVGGLEPENAPASAEEGTIERRSSLIGGPSAADGTPGQPPTEELVQDRSAVATETVGETSRSFATGDVSGPPSAAIHAPEAQVTRETSSAAAAPSQLAPSHDDASHRQAAPATATPVRTIRGVAPVPAGTEIAAQTTREQTHDEGVQIAATTSIGSAPPDADRDGPTASEADTTSALATDANAAPDPTPETPADALPVPVEADAGADAVPTAPAGRARPASVPSFARRSTAVPASRGRRVWEITIVAALALLLGLQLLLSQRARLATDAQWRPLLSSLCAALRCALPSWREPAAFRVLERDVRAQAPGVLRVSARIRNDARWAQPWPALRLTLSDADGRAVASRLFQPHEYLGGTPTQMQLDSGQSAALRMDIVEPGPQAIAFTFDFQ